MSALNVSSAVRTGPTNQGERTSLIWSSARPEHAG